MLRRFSEWALAIKLRTALQVIRRRPRNSLWCRLWVEAAAAQHHRARVKNAVSSAPLARPLVRGRAATALAMASVIPTMDDGLAGGAKASGRGVPGGTFP